MKLRKLLNQNRSRSLKASRRLALSALIASLTASIGQAQFTELPETSNRPVIQQRVVDMLGFSNRPMRLEEARPIQNHPVQFASHNGPSHGVQVAVAPAVPQTGQVRMAVAMVADPIRPTAPSATTAEPSPAPPSTLLDIDIPLPGVPTEAVQLDEEVAASASSTTQTPLPAQPVQPPQPTPTQTSSNEIKSEGIRITFSEDSVESSLSDLDEGESQSPTCVTESATCITSKSCTAAESTSPVTIVKSSSSDAGGPVRIEMEPTQFSPSPTAPSPSDLPIVASPVVATPVPEPMLELPAEPTPLPLVSQAPQMIPDAIPSVDVPMLANPAAAETTEAPRGMRVQIEGEPAMVVTRDQTMPSVTPPPSPTLEAPSYALSDYSIEPEPSYQPRVERSIPARLASQVSQLEDGPEITGLSHASSDMKTGAAVSVGCQDANPISTKEVLAEYSVEHPTICKLIKTGDRTVTIIGLQEGQTRIALVTLDAQGHRSVELREVNVGTAALGQVDMRSLADEVTQTLSRMFPQGQVSVVARGDELIAQGVVPTEKDARKVLSFVRKTTLVPVVDKVQSYGR